MRPLTLKRWQESEAAQARLRPVEIVEGSSESKTVLLTSPRGYRVEGLSEEGLGRLLEQLG